MGLQGFRTRGALDITNAGNLQRHRACRDALVCNLLNPKVIVLFLALYPNFVVIGKGDAMAQVLMLSAVLILINAGWQVGLVGFAHLARGRLIRSAVQRTVGRSTGAILTGCAAAMLWEHLT